MHKNENHIVNSSKSRVFSYQLNEKRAKSKLLKGAKRKKALDVEVKSGCVNLRFNDGSYFEVVLPILREWHRNVGKPFQLNGIEVTVDETDPGIDNTEKHVDTKLVVTVNKNRLVLHAYNSTQNLMVQGKQFENFAVNHLEPFFTERINASIENIIVNYKKAYIN